MRTRLLPIAALVVACGAPASAPPTTTVAPAPPSSAPVASELPIAPPSSVVMPPPGIETPVAPVALEANGLPAISVGPAIHLESLPVTTRMAGAHRVSSVALANPIAQAALDTWFEANAWCHGRPTLALEGLMSYQCRYLEPAAGGDVSGALNERITPEGTLESLRNEAFFLPGTDVPGMFRVWADDPETPTDIVSFGPNGATMIISEPIDEPVWIPWRTLAPYIRADGPLGPPLIAAGLALAPAGTVAPPMPTPVTGLEFYDEGLAIRAAARATPTLRSMMHLRLGSNGAVLLAPPEALDAEALGGERRSTWWVGAMAEMVSARITAPVEVHESAGPRSPFGDILPVGTRVVAARGTVGTRSSELGTGWTLVGTARDGGYVQGRAVVASDGCGAPTAGLEEIAGYVSLDPQTQFAWVASRTAVTLFSVDAACTIGAQVRRAPAAWALTALHVTRANAQGDPWLLVVVSTADTSTPSRTVAVYGPDGDAPLWSAVLDAPVIHLAERRGPDHATGYFPLTVTSGSARTWLAWNGTGLEARVP